VKISRELADALGRLPTIGAQRDYLATLRLLRHGIPIVNIELGSLLRFIYASDPLADSNPWVDTRFGDVLEFEPFFNDVAADRDRVVGPLRRTPDVDPESAFGIPLPSLCRIGLCQHKEHRNGANIDGRLIGRPLRPLPVPDVGWAMLTCDRMLGSVSETAGIMPEYQRTGMNRMIGLVWALQFARSRQVPGVTKSLVSLSPQVGKSTIAHAQTAWMLAVMNGRLGVITASHSDNLAVLRGVFVREMFQDDLVSLPVTIAADDAARDKWRTVDERGHIIGGLRSVGVGSKISGHPADAMLLDDLADGVQEAVGAKGEAIWRVVSTSLMQRIQRRGWLSVLATRWAEADVPGRFLDVEPGEWCELVIPAICEEDSDDPLDREPGQVAVPERFTLLEVEKRVQVLGGIDAPLAQALYQQKPKSISAGHFLKERWGMVSLDPADLLVASRGWDLAGTEGGGDATAGVLVGLTHDGQLIVLDIFHDRLGTGDVRKAISTIAEADVESWGRHCPTSFAIEEQPGAAGKDMRMTQEDILADSGVELSFVKPSGSKVARAYAASSRQLVGAIFFSDAIPQARISGLVKEAEAFPGGSHDDLVDALALAVNTVLFDPPKVRRGKLTTTAGTRVPV